MTQMFGPYRGFSAQVSFDAKGGVLAGRLAEVSEVVVFHAADYKGLDKAFREAVDRYIDVQGATAIRQRA